MTTAPSHVEGLDEGMRALLAARDRELANGATAIGWKVGLNGPAVQALFGLDGLVVGYLNDATVVDDGSSVEAGGWTQPALEVEVALRVGPDGRLAGVAPALELVDLNLPFDRLEPILAGNLFHRGVIFGPEVTPLAGVGLEVSVMSLNTGAELATGALGDDPGESLEVVRAFLARYGSELKPGHRIIAGSITPPLPVTPGDRLTVDFGRLGSLEVAFTAKGTDQ